MKGVESASQPETESGYKVKIPGAEKLLGDHADIKAEQLQSTLTEVPPQDFLNSKEHLRALIQTEQEQARLDDLDNLAGAVQTLTSLKSLENLRTSLDRLSRSKVFDLADAADEARSTFRDNPDVAQALRNLADSVYARAEASHPDLLDQQREQWQTRNKDRAGNDLAEIRNRLDKLNVS